MKELLISAFLQTILVLNRIRHISGECGPPPVNPNEKLDMSWMNKQLKEGMYFSLQTKMEKQDPLPDPPKNEDYKKWKFHLCYDVTIGINDPPQNKTPVLGSSAYFDISVDSLSPQRKTFFILDTPSAESPLHNKFRYFGEFRDWIVDVDKKVLVMSGCVYNDKKPAVLVLSADPSLPPEMRDRVIKKSKDELGIDPSTFSDGSEPYVFQKIRESPVCARTSGDDKGHWHWHAGTETEDESAENLAKKNQRGGGEKSQGLQGSGRYVFGGNQGVPFGQIPGGMDMLQQLMNSYGGNNGGSGAWNQGGGNGFVRMYSYNFSDGGTGGNMKDFSGIGGNMKDFSGIGGNMKDFSGSGSFDVGTSGDSKPSSGPEDSSSPSSGAGNISDAAEAALAETNKYRKKHGADPLSLDGKLSAGCQSYAEKLAQSGTLQHSCTMCNEYGENLWMQGGRNLSPAENAKMAVSSWYDEVKMYNFNNPTFSMSTAHFTALVWKGTTKMGFGLATNTGTRSTFAVARFVPPGNTMGTFQANVGPPQ